MAVAAPIGMRARRSMRAPCPPSLPWHALNLLRPAACAHLALAPRRDLAARVRPAKVRRSLVLTRTGPAHRGHRIPCAASRRPTSPVAASLWTSRSHSHRQHARPAPALLLQLQLEQLGPQQRHGALPVAPLRALLLQEAKSVVKEARSGPARLDRQATGARGRRGSAPRGAASAAPRPRRRRTAGEAPRSRTPHDAGAAQVGAAQVGRSQGRHLAEDADSCGLVEEVHRRLHLVHVLAASAAGPRGGQLDVLFVGWGERQDGPGVGGLRRARRLRVTDNMTQQGEGTPPCLALGSILTSTSSTSGMIATVAVEVCTRPEVSVAGTRCTRCTPDSYLSLLYTLRRRGWEPAGRGQTCGCEARVGATLARGGRLRTPGWARALLCALACCKLQASAKQGEQPLWARG